MRPRKKDWQVRVFELLEHLHAVSGTLLFSLEILWGLYIPHFAVKKTEA